MLLFGGKSIGSDSDEDKVIDPEHDLQEQ